MPGYLFTAHARAVLLSAQAISKRLGHPRVGTEHLLFAIAETPDARTAAALSSLGAPTPDIIATIEGMVLKGTIPETVERPFAPPLLKVLDLAVSEAGSDPGTTGIDTPHLLLGLLRGGNGIGAQILQDAGVTLEAARRALRPS